MIVLLFFIYFFLCAYLLCNSKFIAASQLDVKTILLLFIVKIIAACSVCFFAHYFFNDKTDYNGFNNNGITEYHFLITRPAAFFLSFFKSGYENYGSFLSSGNNYWKDLAGNLIIKMLAVCNVFSRGNIYINALFFSAFCFVGHIALFRIFATIYNNKKWLIICGCFFLPSFLFFSSGIHKDLLAFTGLALFCYALYFSTEKSFTLKKMILLLVALLLVFIARNFLAVVLVPLAAIYYVTKKSTANPFVITALGLVILFFAAGIMHLFFPVADPLFLVAAKQQSFLSLGYAATQYETIDTLTVSFKSFISAAPNALRHSFLSPYPGEFKNVFCNIFSAEMILYWVLFFAMLISFCKENSINSNKFIIFLVLFSCIILLFAGYITPNAGTLIRYRSIYLPFIITPLLCNIDVEKLKKYFTLKL